MKRLFAGLAAVVALAGLVGCNKGTSGGAGVTTTGDQKPHVGQAEDTFSLTVPTLSTHLKQGEAKVVGHPNTSLAFPRPNCTRPRWERCGWW
jgi:hypothetical protein